MAGSPEEGGPRSPHRAADILVVLGCAAAALLLRTGPAWASVMLAERVQFMEADPWYHVRLIHEQVRHFPERLVFDPMVRFPDGSPVYLSPLFDFLVATTAWALGLGSPSPLLVDRVAALAPAVIGAAVVVPTYLIARRLGGRTAGLLAAGLVAVHPGPFLGRTVLGFTDHHCLEVLLSTIAIAAFMAAAGGSTGAALAAGAALGAYLLAWSSGAFLVAILLAWLAVQHSLDHLQGRSSVRVARAAALALAIALLLVRLFQNPWARRSMQTAALLLSLAALGFMAMLQRLLAKRPAASRLLFPVLALVALVAGGLAAVEWLPSAWPEVRTDLGRFLPRGVTLTVTEAEPLAYMGGHFSFLAAWSWFRAGLIVGPLMVVWLAWRTIREPAAERVLAVVWTIGMTAATAGQNRFAYYLAVNAAVLVALAGAGLLELAARAGPDAKPRRQRALALFVIFALAFVPLVRPALATVASSRGPGPDWLHALAWMRHHTPDPLAEATSGGRPSYGVMAWWDYGYWILHLAGRAPVANPSQAGAEEAARFFIGTEQGLETWRQRGVRYVIADRELLVLPSAAPGRLEGKLAALALWAGVPVERYFEVWWERDAGRRLHPTLVLYPEYYRSIAVRLALHGGRPFVASGSSWVLNYTQRTDADGRAFKELVEARRFDRPEAAETELRSRPAANRRLASRDPWRSCVHLAALEGVRELPVDTPSRSVRVFELIPPAAATDIVPSVPAPAR